jgi:pyruvate/2-oxoglutarate dehydrogenase complex dihydrolipoamide dehydrogenase (E3) component
MSAELLKPDLCVIGAGAGGLTAAAGLAMLGRSVVLFEAGEMGGDCLNYGCVPSKALLAAAHAAHAVTAGARLGVTAAPPQIDFRAVMDHVHAAIAAIEPADSQERFESMGVRVIREHARFIDPETVQSDSVTVKAKRFVIAAGARPVLPPVEGLADLPYLTNETVWNLSALPRSLAVLGAGPVGVELGQAFARLGSEVTLIEAKAALAGIEPEHRALALDQLRADGVTLLENTKALRAEREDGAVVLTLEDGRRIAASHVLAAAGRAPRTDGLGLEAAGIGHDARGIVCDDRLKTANRRVYAAGDIAGKGALTHLAGWHGSVIVRRLGYGLPAKHSDAIIPANVYTDPPLARIGMSEAEARDKHGDKITVTSWTFAENDRAVAEGDTRGGVKLVLGRGGKVLGVHAAGARADDVVQYAATVIQSGAKASALTSPVLAYPTRAEALKRAAGKRYESAVFGPFAKALAGLLASLR